MCRSLTSFVGLIDLAMNDFARNLIPASYAETAVLRSCASEVERWNERYQAAVNGAYDTTLLGPVLVLYHNIPNSPWLISSRA